MGSKFGNELGLHLPRGMASSSLPSSATTIASTATASSSMLPPRLTSNASSFSSVDTVLGGRNLGGHAAGGSSPWSGRAPADHGLLARSSRYA